MIQSPGGMAEWLKAAISKIAELRLPGFKSQSLLHSAGVEQLVSSADLQSAGSGFESRRPYSRVWSNWQDTRPWTWQPRFDSSHPNQPA